MLGFTLGLFGFFINMSMAALWDSTFNFVCGIICFVIGVFSVAADS